MIHQTELNLFIASKFIVKLSQFFPLVTDLTNSVIHICPLIMYLELMNDEFYQFSTFFCTSAILSCICYPVIVEVCQDMKFKDHYSRGIVYVG
jgi:hypothetical protein